VIVDGDMQVFKTPRRGSAGYGPMDALVGLDDSRQTLDIEVDELLGRLCS
jgi:hypothetical protein